MSLYIMISSENKTFSIYIFRKISYVKCIKTFHSLTFYDNQNYTVPVMFVYNIYVKSATIPQYFEMDKKLVTV